MSTFTLMAAPLLVAMLMAAAENAAQSPAPNPESPITHSEMEADASALARAFAALSPPAPDDPAWITRARATREEAAAFARAWPDDPRGFESVASISVELSDDDAVDQAFGQLLERWPEKTSGGVAWAGYWASRDPGRAASVLERLIEARPDSLLYINHLHTLLWAHDVDRLGARFNSLSESDPDRLGMELNTLARVAPALAAAMGRQLRAIHPDHLEVAIGTARGLRHANRFAEARVIMDALGEARLTDPAHRYLWSDVHYADHQFQRAHALLSSIDMEALAETSRTGLHRRLRFMKPLREQMAEVWPAEVQRRLEDAARGDNPIGVLVINGREVFVELFEDDAPNTVANFIAAADLGVYDGWEAGLVHPGFRSIMGDRHDGDGWPSWTIPDEHTLPSMRPIGAGSLVAYKTSRPNSTDTTFFILHFPAPHLNGERTTFGRVITGLDVIREMQQGDVVEEVRIISRRDHEYDPQVIDADGASHTLSTLLAEPIE